MVLSEGTTTSVTMLLHCNMKSLKLLMLLITCFSGIGCLHIKKNNEKEKSEMDEEFFSTINSIIKEKLGEKAEEDIEKEENKYLNDLKEEETTKSSVSEQKEAGKGDEGEKETKEGKENETKDEENETKEGEGKETKNNEEEEMLKQTEKPEIEITSSSTEAVSREKEETSHSASPLEVTEPSKGKEKGPEGTFVVWDAKEKICILAKFEVELTITFQSKGGEQKEKIHVPKHGTAKGKCETTSGSPLLQISWQRYVFAMIFNETDDDNWIVTSIEFTYDTSDPFFDGATNAGKKTARSKTLDILKTPMGKSYFCPAHEVVLMYSGTKHVVTARLKDVHLQPYGIEDGEFSPAQRCSKVAIDGPEESPYVQDETVPLAVGCTLALITLLILLGFSFHRAYNAAKVDYNTME